MGRFKRRVGCASGLQNKRDTPMKPALNRRNKHIRLLPNKRYEAFPEEPDMEEMHVKPTNQEWTSIKPVHCKSVLHLSSPAFTENPRDRTVSPAAPVDKKTGHQVSSGHPAVQTTPDLEAFKAGKKPIKEEQNLAGTPQGSVITSSMESDTIFSTDDDDEDDCCSSTYTTSSSLPSPEIFRKENYVETLTFPIEDDLLGLPLHIKNSTLLDVSYAESIHMHDPPNISTIIDASTILAEKNSELSHHGVTKVEPKEHTDPFHSEKAFKKKTPPEPSIRRSIFFKKKVWFRSPVIAQSFEAKTISALKLTIHNESEPVCWSRPAKQIKHDTDTSSTGRGSSLKEDNPEQAKFFDFASDGNRDEFFQKERERFARIRSFSLFPLIAAKCAEPVVP